MIQRLLLSCLLTACLAVASVPAADVSLTVHPDRVVNRSTKRSTVISSNTSTTPATAGCGASWFGTAASKAAPLA